MLKHASDSKLRFCSYGIAWGIEWFEFSWGHLLHISQMVNFSSLGIACDGRCRNTFAGVCAFINSWQLQYYLSYYVSINQLISDGSTILSSCSLFPKLANLFLPARAVGPLTFAVLFSSSAPCHQCKIWQKIIYARFYIHYTFCATIVLQNVK